MPQYKHRHRGRNQGASCKEGQRGLRYRLLLLIRGCALITKALFFDYQMSFVVRMELMIQILQHEAAIQGFRQISWDR